MSEVIRTPIPTFDTPPERIPGAVEPLSNNERAVYYLLKAAEGRIVSRYVLYDTLYGGRDECDQPDESIIRVFICRLRWKLPKAKFITHHGIGYSLEGAK